MSYYLGVDVGTAYTAAAVWRDGRVDIVRLDDRRPVVPSVLLRPEAGEGDDGEASTARVLRWVVDTVSQSEGAAPSGVAVTHPATWGADAMDVLRSAIELAELADATTVSEPEAAAIHYATQGRVDVGSVVAVYDFGAATFDATVLRKSGAGWDILGEAQSSARLGGMALDEAVFRHVTSALGDVMERLDPEDPAGVAGAARLRQACRDAKEVLSADAHTSIPVALPGLDTEVRLTRAELETTVRPTVAESIEAMNRALRSADVDAVDVSAVLLVGGLSRLPIVAQLVGSEMGRPVAVDAHPDATVALGAATAAAERDPVDTAGVPPTQVLADTEPVAAATAPAEARTPDRFEPPHGDERERSRRGVGLVVAAVAAAAVLAAGIVSAVSDGDDGSTTATTAPGTDATVGPPPGT